jgi:hypothetical protein
VSCRAIDLLCGTVPRPCKFMQAQACKQGSESCCNEAHHPKHTGMLHAIMLHDQCNEMPPCCQISNLRLTRQACSPGMAHTYLVADCHGRGMRRGSANGTGGSRRGGRGRSTAPGLHAHFSRRRRGAAYVMQFQGLYGSVEGWRKGVTRAGSPHDPSI